MKTVIAGLILTALTLTTLIVAPLFPHPAPAAKAITTPNMNARFQLKHELRSEKF